MKRAIVASLALFAGTGCMDLDFVILSGATTEDYELSTTIVPAELQEEVTFESYDGTELVGVWAHHTESKPPLIYFHGNTHHLGEYWSWVELYHQWNTHEIFIFDYRSYGKSSGEASIDILEEDGLAAVNYVSQKTGYEPDQIPMIGLSLGASVLLHTNDEVDAQSIIIHDMFLSATAGGNDGTGLDLPTGWFFTESFDNGEAVKHVQAPIFVVHGDADDFVQPKYSETVFANAPEPKELWNPDGVGHGDIVADIPEEYSQRAQAWIAQWD